MAFDRRDEWKEKESWKSMGTNSFSTAVSCFHLPFPVVSVLVGCEGRSVCKRCGGVLDVIPLVSNRVIKMNSPRARGIPVELIVRASLSEIQCVYIKQPGYSEKPGLLGN